MGSQSFSFTSDDETTFASHGLSWSVGDTVVVRLREAMDEDEQVVPTSCTLNPGDLWCGVVTVGVIPPQGTILGHGFGDVPDVPVIGALSDPGFSVVTNGVTTPYTIDIIYTNDGGSLFFSLTSALTAADQAKLVLHVGSASFAFSGVTPMAFHTYSWTGRGLDWSSEDYVTLRLRELPELSVWDAAASGGSEMAFSVTLSEAAAEEVTATWTASIEFGNTAVAADLGSPTTGMVTFAPNATTARFVLRLPQVDHRGDRTFRVTLSGVSANAQLVSNWIATGTIIGTPTSCTLNSGDIWCGVVTVRKKAQLNGKILGWGFHQTWHTDGVGGLPDRRFVYGGDSYRIDEVTVGAGGGDIPAGFLFFSMNRAFPVADEVRLALYVESNEFKLSEAYGPDFNTPTYHWRGTGMNWSVASFVTLRLRGDITAAAHTEDSAAPLTAAFEGLPEEHDGETAFAFRIAFSEAVAVTPAAMRTHVLTVTGGAVTGAARVDGEPGVWAITVTPDTREELSITLAPTAECEADGAVCTADGRALSIGAAHLVSGPPDDARESNTEATGTPAISGTAQVGETLTADTSGIADDDGLKNVSFSYQWLADDTAIQGATGSAYTLIEADEGKTVKVEVSFADDTGNGETLTSTATEAVAAAPQPNNPATGAPGITGTAQVGETLTADTSGIADTDGLTSVTYSYQWQADDADIPGATESTYTLSEAVEGTAISVQVSFTDDAGNEESLTSEDAAAWSAIMRVEWVYQGYGYYSTDAKKAGSLSPASFKVDGTTYTVKMVETRGWMYIGVDRELPFDFVLELDGARFASNDASFRSYSYGNIYKWKTTGLSWKDGDTVEVRLLRAFEDETAVNSAATGAPIISGTVKVGETLTADTSGIADEDGLDNAAFTYQWLADNAAIAGATGSTYTLADADEGKALQVQVTFTDDAGNGETLTSAATDAVTAAPTPNNPATGAPTISGTAQVGEPLTADTSDIADENGLENAAFAYQWIAAGADIAGATGSTYILVDADTGKSIKIRVSFTDDGGNEESLTSTATDAVAAAEPTEPPTQPTGLSGEASHDAITLTWDDPDDDTITGYVILRRNRDIDAEGEFTELVADTETAATTYTDHSVEAETPYTYRIKAINGAGPSERSRWFHIDTPAAPSSETTPEPANTPATGTPTISGTALVGEMLTVDRSGIADEDGLDNAAFTYQWLAGDSDISGATDDTYTLADSDEGKVISIKVSFTDNAGHAETLTSEPTVAVEAKPNTPATGTPAIRGTAQAGETLTAETSAIADEDGLTNAVFAYQWLADGADISGATASTYTIADADEGKAISVAVAFTDDAGNEESLTSEATGAVEARPNSPATGQPAISGTALVGETLTVDASGIADDDGLDNVAYSYQWISNDGSVDSEIGGATGSTYILASGDVGKTIKVRVSFTDDRGHREELTSEPTDAVAGLPSLPLTASLENAATSHDGSGVFTFELRFSEEPHLSYKTLRDQAFTVAGGTVKKAQRLEPGNNIGWRITVQPNGNGQVVIVLPETTDCDVQEAICTRDGRKLSHSLELTVGGPGQ